jgi:hypothetical protein
MSEKFSIVSFYWGNKQNLESYVEHASLFTDDVVIINLDLLNSFESFGIANIINVPYDYLFHNGHDDILNLANSHTKYNWVYYLAVGKRIVGLNMDLMDKYPNSKYFFDKEFNNPNDRWVKFYDKRYTYWTKKVHEIVELIPNVSNQSCDNVFLEWERCNHGNSVNGQYVYNEIERRIYENFRQFTRLKWVSIEERSPHPARENAIIWYNEQIAVYTMGKSELIDYLSTKDFLYGM